MKIILGILMLLIGNNLHAESDIKKRLNNIEGIKVHEITRKSGFLACFKIMVKQPVNHSDTSQGFFYQKVFLSHKNSDSLMLMNVNGYISFSNKISPWTTTLQSNQIYVEHRYFGESKPDTIDYEYLNISNAAKDLHHIKEVFSTIYKNAWISTGISKGGLTAVSYRYFYPNDVAATIALSTSIKISKCDSSFFNFIDSLNNKQGCKKELEDFQNILLTRKEEIIPYLEKHLQNLGKEYSRLGLKTIYEIAVLEIPFSIWQNGKGCNFVDFGLTEPKELFDEMNANINGWFLTDDVFELIDPYHFQALTELGHYCFPILKFSKLLESDLDKLKPVQPIIGIETVYTNKLMIRIKKWAENEASQVIYISGGNDPYSIYRVNPDKNLDSLSLVLKEKNHNQVFNFHIDTETLNKITSLIWKWAKNNTQ